MRIVRCAVSISDAVEGLRTDILQAGLEKRLMLTSGCTFPLPEDWCMRGNEWAGQKVFERGYWKSGEERKAEMDVLSPMEEYRANGWKDR